MLTSHGGEIYIHSLVTSRSILEDSPSISEGAGGRLTDYRISVSKLILLIVCKLIANWFTRFRYLWQIRRPDLQFLH